MDCLNSHFFCKLSFILFFTFTFISSKGQYGNEWISYDQKYYKIPVASDGIYVLDYNKLNVLGLTNGNPKNLQLFHRGVEQSIYIKGEDDGVFNPGDTLYFFGRMNDGTLDSLMYDSPDFQPHKYYNIYSDTTAYFLTASTYTGKRMNLLTSESENSNPNIYKESLVVLTNDYNGGKMIGEALSSFGDIGEGWVSGATSKSMIVNIPISYFKPGMAELELCLVGRNKDPEKIVKPELKNSKGDVMSLDSMVFSNYNIKKQNYSIPVDFFNGNNLELTVNVAKGMISIAYVKLKYPTVLTTNYPASEIFLNENSDFSYKAEINGASDFSRGYDITDVNNVNLLRSTFSEGKLTFDMPSGVKKILIASKMNACSIVPVTFSDYTQGFSSNYLIITHDKVLNGAQEYAAYRTMTGYKPYIVTVDGLYNYFSYGEKTPIAIRRFCKYMLEQGSPEYLLLIGKGLMMVNNRKNYSAVTDNAGIVIEDLVPTYGYPASDVLFSSGLAGKDKFVAALITGRIPARTSEEVIQYLDKVKEHESLNKELLWRKNAVHLTGGKTSGEISRFLGYNNHLKAMYEDTLFGGKVVKTFVKNLGAGYIDDRLKYSIASAVNDGVSYLSYFGHSAPNSTEVDIGKASDPAYGYANKGKYPMLLINGCRFSDSFNKESYAENWILTKDKGAILALSDTWDSRESDIYNFVRNFYHNLFRTNQYVGKTIGEIKSITLENISKTHGGNPDVETAAFLQQSLLHGDPAIIQYRPEKPDYSITSEKLFIKSFTPQKVTAVSDSFAIGIILSNFGITHKDSFAISVTRKINNEQVITYSSVYYKPVNYLDTLYFIIRSKDPATFGSNEFTVSIDFYDEIDESDEVNNIASLNYFVPLSGVTCLFPKEFSIVNESQIQLIAQSTDLMVETTDYIIELDTLPSFASSIKQSRIVNSGSLIKWPVHLTAAELGLDSVVYYWRVRPVEIIAGEDTIWGESSFIYIKDSPEGWSQAHFYQFVKDDKNGIEQNNEKLNFEFTQSITNVTIKTYGTGVANNNLMTEVVLNKSIPILYNGFIHCNINGFVTLALDKYTGAPYTRSEYPTCGRADNRFLNTFGSNQYASLIEYLDIVPDGDIIALISKGNAVTASGEYTSLKLLLKEKFGAENIDSLIPGQAYVLLVKKGAATPLAEILSTGIDDYALLDKDVYGENNYAEITSTLIGPAQEWGSLFYEFNSIHQDYINLTLSAIDLEGKETVIDIPEVYGLNLNEYLSPDNYPYIKLKAELTDTSATPFPAQLIRWQVIYKGVPEGTMNPALANGIDQYKHQVMEEGETLKLMYAFENISSLDFPDSLKVKFNIRNERGFEKDTLVELVALKKDSVVLFTYNLNTTGYYGFNNLQAYVNPRLQPEEYYTNNILETTFIAQRDETNPLLDVVFDGVHIMDGDIVSPNPLITVTLKDENKYLIKNDMQGFKLLMKRPGKDEFEEIDLASNPDIIVTGQVGGKSNVFSFQYNPKQLKDGIYTLRVQATDVTGNLSGIAPYEIRFEVINKSTITYFYPYPNPFSTSTRFVFTLTGSELPEDMKIQIMTISGKVVREITKAEIGPIRIGNNKTEFAWDGTDEFGDRLANGVYLYRVIIRNKGDNFEHRNTVGDKAFHKEFGKLYILR